METIIDQIVSVSNWHIAIFTLVFIMKLVEYSMRPIVNKEKEKREKILKEVEMLKEKYKGAKVSSMDLFTFQTIIKQEESAQFKEEAEHVVKKYKGKPLLIVLPILINIFFFFVFLSYLREVNELGYHPVVPVVTTIITFIAYMTRKQIVFSIITGCLSYWFYTKLNGAMNVFFLMYALFTLVDKIVEKTKRKRKKNEENDDVSEEEEIEKK